MKSQSLLAEFTKRGLVHDATHPRELATALDKEKLAFYCGFDPTADSLHVGSMLPLIVMRRLQQLGHSPIVLLGSATGMIGDPSGKSEERKFLDQAQIEKNLAGMRKQVDLFLDSSGKAAYTVVQNHEWLGKLTLIDYLRDVGKHFSVNSMIAKESVRARLENREQGISYTEFSYMLLQAYDFYHLSKNLNCRLQIGGSDQWGNITAGVDFIRRLAPNSKLSVFGLTFPLLMTASGSKFGKTEKGTVWLDREKTSPYEFYQYWLNTADADVIRYSKLFVLDEGVLNEQTLKELEQATAQKPEARTAQRFLAAYLTDLVHGKAEREKAEQASAKLFAGSLDNANGKDLLTMFGDAPSTEVAAKAIKSGVTLQELLVICKISATKAAARRLIEGGGVYINNERIKEFTAKIENEHFVDSVLVLRSGKKNYHLVKLV